MATLFEHNRSLPAILASLLLIALANTSAQALLVPTTLEKMVQKAHLIVIGTPLRQEKTDRRLAESPVYVAIVRIEEVIKGTQATDEAAVSFMRGREDQPHFKGGQRAIYFIERENGEWWLVQWQTGEVPITQNRQRDGSIEQWVEPYNIVGERREPLRKFIDKIKAILSRTGMGRS